MSRPGDMRHVPGDPTSEIPAADTTVARLLRDVDWVATPLGAREAWPPALRHAVDLILRCPVAMVLLCGPDGIMIYNDAFARVAEQRHPGSFGAKVHDAWPEAVDFNSAMMVRVFAGESLSYRAEPFTFLRSGRPEPAWLDLDYSPVVDDEGRVIAVFAVVVETTAAVVSEQLRLEAETRLRRREAELRRVQQIGRVGGLEVDLIDGFHNRRSPEYLTLHGLPPDAGQESHEAWVARIHPEDREATLAHFLTSVTGSVTDYRAEYRIIRPSDRETRWIAVRAEIERDAGGGAVRLVGTHIDVTERKAAESQLRLLLHELAHRVKNSFTVIQSIANQTLRNAASLEDGRQRFVARLLALARAHDMLLQREWSRATLHDILTSVGGLIDDPARIGLSGPAILVAPQPALALTLIAHELATNAVKYGSLSVPEGRVVVTWRIDEIDGERQFRLRWREENGPPVAEPSRRGFGTRLIERSFPDARTTIATAFVPAGLVFTLDTPLEALAEAGAQTDEAGGIDPAGFVAI